jgi:hypothetical protein
LVNLIPLINCKISALRKNFPGIIKEEVGKLLFLIEIERRSKRI